MAEAYATVGDYRARTPGALTDEQRDQITALLADASALIRSKIPAGVSPDPDLTRALCVAIVKRAVVNPGGLRQRSMTIGGYTESATLTDSGGLYISDAEVALLNPEDDSDQAQMVIAHDDGYRHHRHGRHGEGLGRPECGPYGEWMPRPWETG